MGSCLCEFTQLIRSPCSSWTPSMADESFMSNFKFDHKYFNFLAPQMLYLLCGLVGTNGVFTDPSLSVCHLNLSWRCQRLQKRRGLLGQIPPLCPALDTSQALAEGTAVAALSISYLHSIKLAFQRLSSELPL